MTPFPLNVLGEFGTLGYLVYAVLGFLFGFILESAGFGNSRKLAAQFYFKELTVLKVMFTAIVVAMVLIFLSTGLGLLDYNLIWVNPTYLWPGILGGLIMGVGFIIGGFCPGTSLVAAATLKLDGIFFVAGAIFGIFIFGDTVDFYSTFFNGSYFGRVTLPDVLPLNYGVTVFVIVIMAIGIFWGADWLEQRVSSNFRPKRWRKGAAAALAGSAFLVMLIGQPTLDQRWRWISEEEQARIDQREIYVSPLEVASLQNDRQVRLQFLDIRRESDFNLFHVRDAKYTAVDQPEALAKNLIEQAPNTVFVLASNDEAKATSVWKQLRAASVPNLYVLEGGINDWLNTFASDAFIQQTQIEAPADGALRFHFEAALGDRYPMASPNLTGMEEAFESKVKMERKRAPAGGGCG